MATPLGAMRIDLELDSSKFASNLTASKRAVQYFRQEARTLDTVMQHSGRSMELLSAKSKTLGQAVERQADVVKRLHENFKTLDPGSKKWEQAAIEIEREQGKLEGLRGELDRVQASLVKVHSENSRWGQTSKLLTGWGDKLKGAGSLLREMGDAMRPVSETMQ